MWLSVETDLRRITSQDLRSVFEGEPALQNYYDDCLFLADSTHSWRKNHACIKIPIHEKHILESP